MVKEFKNKIEPIKEDITPVPTYKIQNIMGLFQTVDTAPTEVPRNFHRQIQFVTDSLSSPTVFELHFYSVELGVWKKVALS